MQAPHRDILEQYRQALQTHFPNQLKSLILYGSQARGDSHPFSDIDVLVLVNWETARTATGRYQHPYTDTRWQTIVDLALDVSFEHDVLISPYVMSEAVFARWHPLTEEIKREGIVLWTRE